ncbi:MAG TPA: hypothetical protein VIS06_21200 [Mycobacteriales bacterium]|jgi:hypothetical protein
MADPPTYSGTGAGPDRGAPGGAPRWVKVFGIIAITLVVVTVVLHLTGNSPGGH